MNLGPEADVSSYRTNIFTCVLVTFGNVLEMCLQFEKCPIQAHVLCIVIKCTRNQMIVPRIQKVRWSKERVSHGRLPGLWMPVYLSFCVHVGLCVGPYHSTWHLHSTDISPQPQLLLGWLDACTHVHNVYYTCTHEHMCMICRAHACMYGNAIRCMPAGI